MVNVLDISHPAVEFPLPFDGKAGWFLVPENTTLFFWGAVCLGTKDRIAPLDTERGSRQYGALEDAYSSITVSLSINDESIWLEEGVYKMDGYRGRMWWVACVPEKLPASVNIEIETTGEGPLIDGIPAVLWTNNGDMVPWGTHVESTLEISPSSIPASQFPQRRESLWDRHTVCVPIRQVDR